MKFRLFVVAALAVGLASADDWIPKGTNLEIRTDETIHIRATEGDGRIYPGVVSRDVFDRDGTLLIPRGATAELIVRRIGRDEVAIDLDSVMVNGHRYGVAATETEAVAPAQRGDKRKVGEYAAGGAILGTILGAVAGGGKGAAIGAISGAAVGASAAMATHGRNLNIPVESLLTFRLERAIRIDAPDHGVDRNGRHYHER